MKSIGQLARSAGCHIETIRYYEKRGPLEKPLRSAGGHRLFDPSQEKRLSFIRHARGLRFGLGEIVELIGLAEGGSRSCNEALGLAEHHLDAVNARLGRLERIKDALERMTRECRNGCARSRAPESAILESLAGR